MKRALTLLLLTAVLAACGAATPLPPTAAPTAEPSTATPTATPAPAAKAGPWWRDTVFYEVFVRSFYDSDGDGVGDLPGLLEKLDYLNDGDPAGGPDLGVTGLWLMPVLTSPSYHGYDVVDYYTVNPDYGTNDDFRQFMDAAHARGMYIIIDLVLNHTSTEHPWFVDSASGPDSERRDWYIWSDEDPGYLGPWGQEVWHPRNGAYYYGLFWSGMPDLNLENPLVTAELEDVARFWLEEMDVDGFRLDAARHYVEDGKIQEHTEATHQWLRDFCTFCQEVEPEMLAVAEVWDTSYAVAQYTTEDVNLAFEFSLAGSILSAVNNGRAGPLASTMREVMRLYPAGEYATFLTNHDQNRVMNQLNRDEDKARLAATLLLTLPGVPFLYYGEEIGMVGAKPDELIRKPMQWTDGPQGGFTEGIPWQPLDRGFEERSVAIQSADAGSLLNHYRALIGLRNAYPALRGLSLTPVESPHQGVYAFLRGGQILVVINLEGQAAADYALQWTDEALASGNYQATSLLAPAEVAPLTVGPGGVVEGYQPLPELPARSALVLALAPAGE
ncbi:MAG: alpha-amylase family glycosyl hydrolase [Anaerolineae bacterium]